MAADIAALAAAFFCAESFWAKASTVMARQQNAVRRDLVFMAGMVDNERVSGGGMCSWLSVASLKQLNNYGTQNLKIVFWHTIFSVFFIPKCLHN